MKSNSDKIKFFIFLAFILITLVMVFFTGLLHYNSESVKNLLSGYYYLAIVIYIILVAIAAATTLPITVALIAGILTFSFLEAVLYAFLGIFIGAFVVYYISKIMGRDSFKYYSNLKKERLSVLNKILHENSFSFVMLLNFVYFFPSNLAHMVAGITNMKIYKFSFATAAGNFPNTFAVALVIYGIYNLNYFYIISAVIILVLMTAIPLYVYRKHIRDIIILAFSRNAWKRILKAERVIKKTEKTVKRKIKKEERRLLRK